jgi:hypothetical protein
MLTDFCQDQYAQKLVAAPVDPASAFADYQQSFSQVQVYTLGLRISEM